MKPSAVSDTHATIWYLNADPRLSVQAKTFIDEAGKRGAPILVSAISLVEMTYLCEKGRIPRGTLQRLDEALHSRDAVLQVADLTLAIAQSISNILRDEVPDMPDRIIAATALHFGVPVISLTASAIETIW